ncbi:MAG: hypothetical protein AAFU78_17985 [Cyanobacteria bacterium J06633_2]
MTNLRPIVITSQSNPKRWDRIIVAFVLALLMAIATMIGIGWQRSIYQTPLTISTSPESQVEVSTLGRESVDTIPFWIWVVLPRLFPEKLPGAGGYTALGLTWKPGYELPIGFMKDTSGTIPQVQLNDPANANFDVERYTQFLIDCARDPRFNANFILPEITYNINLSLWEKLAYRFFAIPSTKKTLLNDLDLEGSKSE